MKKRRGFFILVAILLVVALSACSAFKSDVNSLKGSLIGVSYTANFYDNYGAKFLTASGTNIDIDGNTVKEYGIDSDGSSSVNYSLSSVLTITIDGKQIESCGNTIIFAESGLRC